MFFLSALDIEDWERHLGTTDPGEAVGILYRWECVLVTLDGNYRSMSKAARELGLGEVADELKAAALDVHDIALELHDARMSFLRKEAHHA